MNKEYHFFWNGPFSNWDPSPFICDGVEFSCEEQHMMYHKALMMGDEESADKVMATKSPKEQKAIGRQVKNFDPVLWASKCDDIVYEGLKAKFLQNPEHFEALKAAKDKIIVEASPEDRIWGIGYFETQALENITNWGENKLGKLLNKLANEICT